VEFIVMRRTAIIFSAIGFLSILPASAADIARPVYKAPPPVPVATWTGFYIGGNLGYGWGTHEMSQSIAAGPGALVVPAGTTLYGGAQAFDVDPRGIIGGGQIGYNWQFHPSWVFGVETDFQASDMKRSTGCIQTCNVGTTIAPGFLPAFFPVTFSDNTAEHKLNWFGTVRGRLGYTNGPSLFYVTGGLAYGEVERNASVAGTTTAFGLFNLNTFNGTLNAKSTKTGWTLGGGMETVLAGAWTIKAEYLFMDFGSVTDSFNTIYRSSLIPGQAGQVAGVRTISGDLNEHILRVGLNYRFGG
jgi:outer membrane immunogenic protein